MDDVATKVVGQVVEVCGDAFPVTRSTWKVFHIVIHGGGSLYITKGGSGTTSGDRGRLKKEIQKG
jgi:hypothetical protein